jgi:hypothetical protein
MDVAETNRERFKYYYSTSIPGKGTDCFLIHNVQTGWLALGVKGLGRDVGRISPQATEVNF